MSLDVYVETVCPHCQNAVEHGAFNYTYNLSGLWYDALKACGVSGDRSLGEFLEQYGGILDYVVPTLSAMLAWMETLNLANYDAKNGWGTGTGGRDFVRAIRDCCREHPGARIRVSR